MMLVNIIAFLKNAFTHEPFLAHDEVSRLRMEAREEAKLRTYL